MKTSIIPVTAPQWFLLDASGHSLGEVASKVAHVLRGKHKPTFSPHQPGGDCVIIVNVEKLAISQAKGRRKMYYDHTGHPGGISKRTLGKKFEESPEDLLHDAVKGMLPKNRLRPVLLKRLHIHQGADHRFAAQKPVPFNFDIL
jgi:large subunit ribosomal protein L13